MEKRQRQPRASKVEPPETAELDRIARELAAKKANGTVRRFDDLDAIREAARAR